MITEQKTSIEVGPKGVTLTGDQSDYTGMIIGGGILVLIILAVTLLKWGPEKFRGMFKAKNGNGKTDTGSLNGRARLEDISKDLRSLHLEIAGIRETVDQNALNLEVYKREVDKKIAEKDAVDVEQREKIKALQVKVFGDVI